MPGLVNTHCHAAMTLQRSRADDIPLMRWLHEFIWPFEACQTPDDVALGMELGIVEMLLGGVTSFVDMYYFQHRCVGVAERLGIRAVLGCNYFDSNIDEVLPQIGEAVRLAAGSDRVRIAVAPHSPYTVSPENLVRGRRAGRTPRAAADDARRRDTGRGAHRARTLRHHAGRPPRPVGDTDSPDDRGALRPRDGRGHRGPRRARRHGVAQPAEQHEDLERRGPVARMLREGVTVTVATDGPCSNNDLDMWEELRTAAFLQKSATGDPCALPAREALRLATANGAGRWAAPRGSWACCAKGRWPT